MRPRRLILLHFVLLVLPSLFIASAHAADPAAAAQVAVDYQRARFDPIHFRPAIETATDDQCLACHKEVLEPTVNPTSPAGVPAATAKAWYERLSTYSGPQETFHRRHLVMPLARRLMNLKCTTCHQGSDVRDKNPASSATSQRDDAYTLRKTVNPEQTCLMCHGQMNWPVMGLPDAWPNSKAAFQNNCLLCHAAIRTHRHQVNFLNAQAIEEEAAKPEGGDVCFGCHGGRAWYRIKFPYPRHAWDGMDPTVPDWARTRPTQSNPRFLTGLAAIAANASASAPSKP